MMIRATMIDPVTVALALVSLLGISSCKGSTNVQTNSPSNSASPVFDNQPSPTRSQMESRVSIRVHEQNPNEVIIELKNESDYPIYVSYQLPKEGNTTTFLSYGIEQRTARGTAFTPYGDDFHFVPKLSVVTSRAVVLFKVLYPPGEKGEYRVVVGYYDDEEVYELINKKAANLTNEESQRANENLKFTRSDIFKVQTTSER